MFLIVVVGFLCSFGFPEKLDMSVLNKNEVLIDSAELILVESNDFKIAYKGDRDLTIKGKKVSCKVKIILLNVDSLIICSKEYELDPVTEQLVYKDINKGIYYFIIESSEKYYLKKVEI